MDIHNLPHSLNSCHPTPMYSSLWVYITSHTPSTPATLLLCTHLYGYTQPPTLLKLLPPYSYVLISIGIHNLPYSFNSCHPTPMYSSLSIYTTSHTPSTPATLLLCTHLYGYT